MDTPQDTDTTPLRALGWGEAERLTLTSRGIKTVGDLRRLGIEGLRARGIGDWLLELCGEIISGEVTVPPKAIPEPKVEKVVKVVKVVKPRPPKVAKPKEIRPPIDVVCEQGHEHTRPRSPHTYKPCGICQSPVSKK